MGWLGTLGTGLARTAPKVPARTVLAGGAAVGVAGAGLSLGSGLGNAAQSGGFLGLLGLGGNTPGGTGTNGTSPLLLLGLAALLLVVVLKK